MSEEGRHVAAYFCLVGILTIPFSVLGEVLDIKLLPGLPISALAVVAPALAAGLMSLWHGGWPAVVSLLMRAVDYRSAGWRLLVIVLINPVLFGLALLALRFSGADIPSPSLEATNVLILFALFLPGALLEELGWSGYALDRLQARCSPLAASLILGAAWAVWHYPALTQLGRSFEWIAW